MISNKKNSLIANIIKLGKSFKKNLVFRNLSFRIALGDRIALVARNGGGKTTFVDILCGLQTQTTGEIIFANKAFFKDNVGIHFQGGNYPGGITTNDVIYLYKKMYNLGENKELRKHFEIDSLNGKIVNKLSFGERKRMELFLLIASKKKILILDEVTSGMDFFMANNVVDFIGEYIKKNNITLIYISHNLHEIAQLCNRVIYFNKDGVIINEKIINDNKIEEKLRKALISDNQIN